ncbi:MAG: repressor LexA [Burkholderiales bacterium]|nr:repressor LexA [Burkholderiales bacterium]
MDELTSRQAEILRLIREHLASRGYPPTRAEICRIMGFSSPNAAEEHLKALARKGVIEIAPGASRGLRLKEAQGMPVVGRVAAGSPILAESHIEVRYRIDPLVFRPRADYLLRVRGSSMRDAGILDGDLLAVHAAREPRPGEIVVARINDEVTVKRYRRNGNTVHLLPANPDFKPLSVNLKRDAFAIEGIGVGVIRNGKML